MDVEFDYSKLRGRIVEFCGTQDTFARKIHIGRVSLSNRLNNKLDFTASEISRAAKVLKIDPKDVPEYFFAEKVQKHEL